MSSTTLVNVIHGVVAVVLMAAATVLLALHDIDGTTAMALYGAALVAVGAGTSTALALKVPAPPEPPAQTPPV